MSSRTSSKSHGCNPKMRPKSLIRDRKRKAITRINSEAQHTSRAAVHADAVVALNSEF